MIWPLTYTVSVLIKPIASEDLMATLGDDMSLLSSMYLPQTLSMAT